MVIDVLLQRNSYLFTISLYFKSHRILSCCLTPFHLPLAPDQLSKEFYFIVFSIPSFFFLSSSLPPTWALLLTLIFCFPHPLKIIFLKIPIPALLNFIQLSLLSTLLWFFCNFSPIDPVPFQFYFKPHSILFPFLTPLFPSPFCVLLML